MENLLNQLPLYQLILLLIFVVVFLWQIILWLKYSKISKYRSEQRVAHGDGLPEVSIIVIVGENPYYIEERLPKLLGQQHPQFEVVVVNDCGGSAIDDQLEALSKQHPNLRYTTIKEDDLFNHSRKIPLVVGIKAAQYENIMITDTNTAPTDDKWLSYMCRGFVGADLVIGYSGYNIEKGLTNRVARASRLITSIRYLRKATKGRPYRGIYNNIGYTKEIFFKSRGYTNLSLTIGEDDLFVQRLRECGAKIEVIINPQTTLRQDSPVSFHHWWAEQKYRTYGLRFYPFGVKLSIFIELFSQILLFVLTPLLITLSTTEIISIPYLWAAIAMLFLLREIVLYSSIKKICKRLGETKLHFSFMLYDLFMPITEMILSIKRRISPPKNIWLRNKK